MNRWVAKMMKWFYYGLSIVFVGAGVGVITKFLPAGGILNSRNRWLLGSAFLVYGVYRFTDLILRDRRRSSADISSENHMNDDSNDFMDKKTLT